MYNTLIKCQSKGITIIKIVHLIIVVVCMFMQQAHPSTSSMTLTQKEKAFIASHPQIVLGTEKSWEPYVIVNEDGSISGYDVDILNRINQLTGANFVLKAGNWRDMQEQAKKRQIDGLSTGGIHKERKAYLNFSDVYISLKKMVLVAKGKDSGIKTSADLKDKVISIHRGNLVDEKIALKYPDSTILPLDTVEEMIKAVVVGDADATFGNGATLYQASQLGVPYLEIAFELENTLELAFGVRKDWPEAVSILNKGLSKIDKLDRIKLIDKWFLGSNYSAHHAIENLHPLDWLNFSIVWKSLSVIVVITLAIIFWNRRLANLNKQIQSYVSLIDHSLLLVTLNKKGEFQDVSTAFCEWSGWGKTELIGKSHEVFFESAKNKIIDDSKHDKGYMEMILMDKKGDQHWIQINPLSDFNAEQDIVTYIIYDITDKMNALKMEHESRMIEQKKMIVNDMHDGIGGLISIMVKNAEKGLNAGSLSEKNNVLSQILSLSSEGYKEIRILMNVLNTDDISKNFMADMRHIANVLLQGSEIELSFDFNEDGSQPTDYLDQHYFSVYRFYKEAITNVIKHAEATVLQIYISCEKNALKILISDNGIGFDYHKDYEGNGLKSMSMRAAELDADLNISSDQGGTTIKVCFPFDGNKDG